MLFFFFLEYYASAMFTHLLRLAISKEPTNVAELSAMFLVDKLDGLSHGMHKREAAGTTMEDYLQLADDYFARKTKPGKKMVSVVCWPSHSGLGELRVKWRCRYIFFLISANNNLELPTENRICGLNNRVDWLTNVQMH